MITNIIRDKIFRRTHFARQNWKTNFHNLLNKNYNELIYDYKRFGNKNKNKFFYVIKRSPGAGFFSNLNFVIQHLLIADKKNFIPVIDMENFQTFYNCKTKIKKTKNSWNYYFKPVSSYDLKEVYNSYNVIFCDNRTSVKAFNKEISKSIFRYFNGFQFLSQDHKNIINKYIKIDEDIEKEALKIYRNFKHKKVLGICFRGTDAKLSAYQPHAPTLKQMLNHTEKLLKKYNFNKIYLCTEDINYLKIYKKKYGDMLIFNYKSPRTNDKVDLFSYPQKNHRYKVGRGNLVDMIVLQKVDHLLSSVSNIPYTALFFSKKNITHSVIDNGIRGGLISSYFSYYIKRLLPEFLGGFNNKLITKKKLIKPKKSDFPII